MKKLEIRHLEMLKGEGQGGYCFFALPNLLGSVFIPAAIGSAVARFYSCWTN